MTNEIQNTAITSNAVVTLRPITAETVRAVTRPVPPEVQQVVAVSARPREVPISWAASADSSVVGYEVWRSTGSGDDWAQIVRLNSRAVTSYLDRGGERDGTRLGQLSDGTTTRRLTPVDVSGLSSGVSAVSAGGACSLRER